MKIAPSVLALVLFALVPTMAGAWETPQYSAATIQSLNTTVDLVPSTSSSGHLWGIKCLFPNTTSVRIQFTIDGTASSFVMDPTNFERESNGAGQFLSGWIPMNVEYINSIQVQLNNTSLGTATIHCWASWSHG